MNEIIRVNQEYEALLPKLSDNEFKELKESVQKNGLFYPIIVNESNIILDGHTRFRACQELGINPKTEIKVFDNVLDEKEFVLDSNIKRRQLTVLQRCEIGDVYLEIETERAKQRQSEAGLLFGRGKDSLVTNDNYPINNTGKALEIAAKKANIGYYFRLTALFLFYSQNVMLNFTFRVEKVEKRRKTF